MCRNKNKNRIICCYSAGSLDRMFNILKENDFKNICIASDWKDALNKSSKGNIALIILELPHGFIEDDLFIASEQDIWGERKNIRKTKKISADNLISDISSLNIGEYVVHIEHGIGKFAGLENIITDGISHDCLKLVYANNDKCTKKSPPKPIQKHNFPITIY